MSLLILDRTIDLNDIRSSLDTFYGTNGFYGVKVLFQPH